MSLRAHVLAALGSVHDPELDEPITTLGFVGSCVVDASGAVDVRLRLPTPQCAPNFAYLMVAEARSAVLAVPGVRGATVVLEDHYTEAEINAAVGGGTGFAGAFPGAQMPRTGRIEQAHRGTLFLDHIDALDEPAQLKVQRVLEHREITPLGATAPRRIDLRIVSASAVDLERAMAAGRLRPSLFYRLNGVTLRLPPLRERREDIVPLFRTFVVRAAARLGVAPPTLGTAAFRHLERHDWLGNMRELIRFAENEVLGLGAEPAPAEAKDDLKARVDRFEAQAIEDAMTAAGGDASKAMATLNLPRKTFYYKVQRLGIDLARFRD